MSVIQTRFLGFLIIFSSLCSAVAIKKGYYTVVAPRIIRPDSIFHVSFTLNDFQKSCWFNISIASYLGGELFGFDGIEVQPGTTKLVEMHAPHFNRSYGQIKVLAYRGIIDEESSSIDFETEKYWTFIQTNKPKYKPGELVQFRVICIDQLKRPANLTEVVNVQIYDDRSNLIRTIRGIKFVNGVFRGEFQLSSYPVLGLWVINVIIGEKQREGKTFEVDRYVLPTFSVKIDTRNVAIEEEQIEFEISASYFYDEPVKGNLSIKLSNINAPYPQVIPTLTRETQIDGNTKIVFGLKTDLQLKDDLTGFHSFPFSAHSTDSTWLYKFHIEAIVMDGVSEEQSWTATEFTVYTQPFKIELQAPSVFKPDPVLSIKVQVFIRDLNDNLIEDPKPRTEIIVGCSKKNSNSIDDGDFEIVRIEYHDKIGDDFFMINITNKNYSDCYLYAEYQRSKSPTMRLRKSPLDIDILTKSPEEGKELEIKITSADVIEEFSYEIVARRDIIQSGHVNVPGNQTTYILRLDVTFAMVPKIAIFVHHIKNMHFRGQMKDVIIKRAFQNSIGIETEKGAKPGAPVYVSVTTDEGSYVGLMGLDRSALQSINKKDIFDGDNVNVNLAIVNSPRSYFPISDYGGHFGDIITFSNAFLSYPVTSEGGGGGLEKRIRKLFPESWLYVDFEWTPAGGIQFKNTTPDTITTWAITGFSIHPDTGLTFTKNTTDLRVFQEFFISMDLPSSVKEGEVIEIPIYISNYMNQDALTNVTIETDSEGLEILHHSEAVSKPNRNISVLVSAKKREKIFVSMKPLKHGNYNVTVQAISSVASDGVQKTLNVQPQGIPYAMSKTYLVHLPEEGTQEEEITIDIPDKAVPGSERVEASVVGDIFRPLMRDLQKLARVPYGNGEENMRLIVCNSIVLKYLKTLNYSNPSLENQIRINIELGYQNQLSYKHLDGSFGLFERKYERTGDVWQTVFALWGLRQAYDYAHVDPEVIDRGLSYLKSKQQKNGCFQSQSGIVEEDVKFTAFGLMVFLMDESSKITYNEVIKRGLEFLNEITDDLEYSAISVLSTYVLILGKHENAVDQLERLTSNSSLTTKQILWTKSDTLESHLEAIASSLVNLYEFQEIPEQSILHIVRELIVSKIEESSITHLIALQAMVAFVQKLFSSRTNLDITFKDDEDKSGAFRVNAENSQDLQMFEISQSSRKMHIQSKGHGFAVVDVRYNYNLVPEDQTSPFYSTNISTKKTSKYLGVLKMCLSGTANETRKKLTVMEVYLQSGFIFTEKDSQEVENPSENIMSVQFNDGREKVVVYFELSTNEACLELEIRKSFNVLNSKPGWIIVYGAHDKDQKLTKSFRIDDFL